MELLAYREAKREQHLKTKLEYQQCGYNYQLSVYGMYQLPEESPHWIRIEILSQTPFNPTEVWYLKEFFKRAPPPSDLILAKWDRMKWLCEPVIP